MARVAPAILLILVGGCASTQAVNTESEPSAVLRRLNERRDSISSAVYRVRWRTVGVKPHAEFILEIAYKAPDRYRVVATGPFGVPAFTAVVIGDHFTFVNHRDRKFITDSLANLAEYEFPVAEFFEGPWRDLFGGGWGGSREVESLRATKDGGSTFAGSADSTEWLINWNRGRNAPSRVSACAQLEDGELRADVWFDGYNRGKAPFWRLDRLVLHGVAGDGEHRWSILKQDYNVTIPERFFDPLQPAQERDRP